MDGYSYDASGDLLNDGAHSYAYDAEHRVVSVDNGGTATYTYNAAGQRATKSGGRQYLYDLDGNMVAEITNGVWSRGEVYAGGRRWATYANGTTYFNYADWLGTVRVNTQYGGGWTQTCQSLPFGDGQACTNGAGPSPDFFTGKPRDTESGNDDFGARYYNAAGGGNADLGRFLTPDWSAGAAAVPYADFADPQTLNLYAYAQNNPLTLTDPNGHCSWFGCLSQLWKEMGGYDDGTRHEIGNTGIVVKDKPAAGNCGNPCNVTATPDPAETVWERINPVVMFLGGFTNLFINNKASGAVPLALSMGSLIPGEEEVGAAAEAADAGAGAADSGTLTDLGKSLASQQQMGEGGTPLAGAGTGRVLRVADDLAAEYGGSPGDWAKMTSSSYTAPDGAQFETHWYENVRTGQRVLFKTKFP